MDAGCLQQMIKREKKPLNFLAEKCCHFDPKSGIKIDFQKKYNSLIYKEYYGASGETRTRTKPIFHKGFSGKGWHKSVILNSFCKLRFARNMKPAVHIRAKAARKLENL